MNILPKKSWHVRNKDNVARVRRDEAQAAEEEREAKRRVERAEQEARTEYLRRKARAGLQSVESTGDDGSQSGGHVEHLNLFPLEESSDKKGNEEYLKEKKEETEKQERAIGLLVSLGPQPGTEVTPWYMQSSAEKEEEESEKRKGIIEEEKAKKDRRLKESLDPLKDMKKALGESERRHHKSKKKERGDKGEKRSSGESSMERLRAERLQREAEERRRAQALLEQRSGKRKDATREMDDRDRPYNNAYFPEIARKRQRRDRESWRDEILKS
ncbi:leukocyte receptor cluster member 1 [Oryzias latipes]|uniref:Leukocyte receptor cluster (LRC) member 1 n=1 Tax=Oryzias latipes TaxID=8090 RepID=H2M6F7_ORYLA|nr:leukocyte receptor cluster member 1 [Oryzias latipes]